MKQRDPNKQFENILNWKREGVIYFFDKIKETRNSDQFYNYKTKMYEYRKPNMPISKELAYLCESFLYQFTSYFDVLIKDLHNRDLGDNFNFTDYNLKSINPETNFTKFLIKVNSYGLENNPYYSIKQIRKYRGTFAHGNFLISPKPFQTKNNISRRYVMPDNPAEKDHSKLTYDKNIGIITFIEKINSIITEIQRRRRRI